MTLVDANVLLYAINTASPQHEAARTWLDHALSSSARVGLPWLSLLAFVRIATHPSVFPAPLSTLQALEVIEAWCRPPNVVHPEPSRTFATTFTKTLTAGGARGNLVNDAYLAALAIEYGATVVTFDRDFARFDGVTVSTPGAPHDLSR
ncbi:MAG: type II toxin-antitoxin system VapC family toxin [Trueperaceae bacterium]|nr:type II toxin-antitoxin system VapC family toxin [Trueperaceae bacterium]